MASSLDLNFAYAHGAPVSQAKFRSEVRDFIVTEDLGFEPSGEGEHLYLLIKKRGENTAWVADKLALFLKLKAVDIGYCGKKDRHAETTQWFSAYLPGGNSDFDATAFTEQFELDLEVLKVTRHPQKLRRGGHQSNAFIIKLRDVTDLTDVCERLEKVKITAVPNYFGEQRFGREGNNLVLAQAWLEKGELIRNRNKRGMIMSAARSLLFNRVLSQRVETGTWRLLLDGDVADENQLPTGPLWGRGRSRAQSEALAIENTSLQPYAAWCESLEHVGLNQERRPLVLGLGELTFAVDGSDVELSFTLAPGEFATSVLREICVLDNQKH